MTRRTINRRAKGHAFEREVASDLRDIYDPPALLEQLYDADTPSGRAAALKRSRVRRGEQAHGALEPDVVIAGSELWLELQCADPRHVDPMAKLQQAERDVEQTGRGYLPIAITRQTGGVGSQKRGTQVHLRLSSLLAIGGQMMPATVVSLAYSDFLQLLQAAHDWIPQPIAAADTEAA